MQSPLLQDSARAIYERALFASQRAFQPVDPFVNTFEFGLHQVFEVVKALAHIVEALIEEGPEVIYTSVLVEEPDDDSEANQKRRSPLAQDCVGGLHLAATFIHSLMITKKRDENFVGPSF